eukprot:scaffold261107_cov24-Attheya_sp.AAC.1
MAEANPALPRVMKIRKDGKLAGEMVRMVDGLRGVGNDETHARQVGRTTGAMGGQSAGEPGCGAKGPSTFSVWGAVEWGNRSHRRRLI